MLNEMYYLRELFGGGDRTDWLNIIFMLVLVGIRIFKSEQIHSPGFFRWSCWFYVLSFLLPVISWLALEFLGMPQTPQYPNGETEFNEIYVAADALQPGLLSLSMFFLFAAISPRRQTTKPQGSGSSSEKKHPLD